MEIDIRKVATEEIDTIRFRDVSSSEYYADCIFKDGHDIKIQDSDSERNLVIGDAAHALDLIEALKKAIELGWFE